MNRVADFGSFKGLECQFDIALPVFYQEDVHAISGD
jgi:hypothetical protein